MPACSASSSAISPIDCLLNGHVSPSCIMESISGRSPSRGRVARQHPAGLAHAFHPAGDDQIDVAAAHALRREHHGFQSRAAHLVDRQRRDRRRQSGSQRRLPRGRLADAGREHVAENHFVDVGRFDAGPRHGLAHRDRAQAPSTGSDESDPRNLPIGVRHAESMKASDMAVALFVSRRLVESRQPTSTIGVITNCTQRSMMSVTSVGFRYTGSRIRRRIASSSRRSILMATRQRITRSGGPVGRWSHDRPGAAGNGPAASAARRLRLLQSAREDDVGRVRRGRRPGRPRAAWRSGLRRATTLASGRRTCRSGCCCSSPRRGSASCWSTSIRRTGRAS